MIRSFKTHSSSSGLVSKAVWPALALVIALGACSTAQKQTPSSRPEVLAPGTATRSEEKAATGGPIADAAAPEPSSSAPKQAQPARAPAGSKEAKDDSSRDRVAEESAPGEGEWNRQDFHTEGYDHIVENRFVSVDT